MVWGLAAAPAGAMSPRALDPRWVDPSLAPALARACWAAGWSWLGEAADAPAPGAYAPRTWAPGALDEPVLLTRTADGALRALSNVCTHRAARLVDRPGAAARLRCPYHGRRFSLDGQCVSSPGFEGVPGFPSAEDALPTLGLRVVGPLLLAALDPAVPADAVERLSALLDGLPTADAVFSPAASEDPLVEAHWLLYVENYLEGMHIPFVHPALARAVDLGAYRIEASPGAVLQVAPAPAGGGPVLPLPVGHPLAGDGPLAAFYLWIFPGLMVNVYPWGLSINALEPLGPARTRVRYRTLVWDPAARGAGAGADVGRTEAEDAAVVARVQSGIRSARYRPGRLAPAEAPGIGELHRAVAAAAAAAGITR